MNWKLDKYYTWKEMPLPEKIWGILIITIPIVLIIFWILFGTQSNTDLWFAE